MPDTNEIDAAIDVARKKVEAFRGHNSLSPDDKQALQNCVRSISDVVVKMQAHLVNCTAALDSLVQKLDE